MGTRQTFRAATSSYLILCGLFAIPAMLWLLFYLRTGKFEVDFFVAVWILPAAWAAWLAAFRLRLDDTGITYRSPFGGSRRAEYSRLTSVTPVLLRPNSALPLAFVLTQADGKTLRINMKPFPRGAVVALEALSIVGSNKSLERTREG